MTRSEAQQRVERVDVVGTVSDRQRDYAIAKIGSLAQYARVHAARVAVGAAPGGSGRRSVRVNLSGDHVFVHAEADGESVYEAIDLVRQRLYRQLTRRQRGRHGPDTAHIPQRTKPE